jgi:drug/metabolite transporter (DMT)-like permease
MGSLAPIVATLMAVTFLQESLEIIPLLGLCLTAAGVILASRAHTN